ncbi:MAG TPA: 2OG-Fe(II) oxygenase [Rhodothermales bacterium]|nr:2OG-Fe(II) oxygenase [Rhodothermales bacterium]
MIDLLVLDEVLDAAARTELLTELRASAGVAATVTGRTTTGAVESHVRRAAHVHVVPETRARVAAALDALRPAAEAHFGEPLGACEPPQFLRYEAGDFFVPHQDGNTPLIRDDTRFRRVSAVLFLSTPSEAPEPDTYGGGALRFYASPFVPSPPTTAPADPGTLVAFRSETTHEVTPVTHGERYTVVTWFRAVDAPPPQGHAMR